MYCRVHLRVTCNISCICESLRGWCPNIHGGNENARHTHCTYGVGVAYSVLEWLWVCVANSPCEILSVGPLMLRHRDMSVCRIKIFLGIFYAIWEKSEVSRRGERLIWSPREVINRVIHSYSPYGDTREVFMTVIQIFFGVIITLGAFFFMIMSSHMVEEQRKGERIPTFWEKKWW